MANDDLIRDEHGTRINSNAGSEYGTRINQNAGSEHGTRINRNAGSEYGTHINPKAVQPAAADVNSAHRYTGPVQAGTVIHDRYRIDRGIHTSGAEAALFYGIDMVNGTEVCIKLYNRLTDYSDEVRNLLLKLDHPNVAKLLDCGRWEHGPYEVWTFYHGENFREILQRRALSPEEMRDYLPQMNEALRAAHEAGVIHSDVKPENFMLVEDGRENWKIVLIDFGVSVAKEKHEDRTHVTRIGRTNQYSPFEVLLDRYCWPLSDYYSLGVTVYELLTGKTPYANLDENDLRTWIKYLYETTIPGIDKLPEDYRVLVFGLMQGEIGKRWGYEAVNAWIRGDYEKYIIKPSAPKEEGQGAAFTFRETKYRLPSQIGPLMESMAENWDDGKNCMDDQGRLFLLTQRLIGVDDELAQICNTPRGAVDADFNYFNKLYLLHPNLKYFAWKGLFVNGYKRLGLLILNALWEQETEVSLFGSRSQNDVKQDDPMKLSFPRLEEIFSERLISRYLGYQQEAELEKWISALENQAAEMKRANNEREVKKAYFTAGYLLSGSTKLKIKTVEFKDKEEFVRRFEELAKQAGDSGDNKEYLELCRKIRPKGGADPGFRAWAETVCGVRLNREELKVFFCS